MEIITKITYDAISKMSDKALLAYILSSGGRNYCSLELSAEILKACKNSLNWLYRTPVNDLVSKGLSLNDTLRIKAVFELARRQQVAAVMDKPKISCSKDVYQLFQHLSDLQYEEFWIIVLSKANKVVDRIKISEGGISGTVVDPKKVFKFALDTFACSLILVHNHPSGNIQPSEADIKITQKIVDAGKLLEVAVLDHIIVGLGYFSFADDGII